MILTAERITYWEISLDNRDILEICVSIFSFIVMCHVFVAHTLFVLLGSWSQFHTFDLDQSASERYSQHKTSGSVLLPRRVSGHVFFSVLLLDTDLGVV